MHTVPQSCRTRLKPRDLDFLCGVLLGKQDAAADEALKSLFRDPGSLDAILEHPKLLEALLKLKYPLAVSPELFFFVVVRHCLKDAGVDRIDVADYVAATLAQHARGSAGLTSAGDAGDEEGNYSYHIDYLQEIDRASEYDRFYLHVECGNRFLVLTGLFPRYLERREERKGAPGVSYYEGVVRDSFLQAANHRLAGEFALTDVYRELADCFTFARRGLNRMAEEYLFLGA